MSSCRVARRIGWRLRPQNPWVSAGRAPTLARKVLHYPCHPFLLLRGGRQVGGQDGGWSSTGVMQLAGRGGKRRVGWRERTATTPSLTVYLVTNGCQCGGEQ
jgi:hypothetical protein